MKRIVDIVPARPGWYARWQLTPGATRCYPVTLWALVEDTDAANREVIGVDAIGQWPGADDNEAGVEFVRYLFQAPEAGEPDDIDQPTDRAEAAVPATAPPAPQRQPAPA
ncbi:hypothetical protein [Micromonospora echinofusca]|uniref:hypothetical protein n=1 Tax=Micromonospora echinofusca TaxID=47858 RepID=UPI001FCCA2F5|nr:hypothetical protein [Micromonospora echinofusca]